MEDIKKLFIYFRNALAFSYSWLVLCYSLAGFVLTRIPLHYSGFYPALGVDMLLKLFLLCAWGSACFVFAFFTKLMRKRGFIFDLTVFFILFIPVEVLMFYWMEIFNGKGLASFWLFFGIIVISCYIAAILIDVLVMRKRAKTYTEKLIEYNSRKS